GRERRRRREIDRHSPRDSPRRAEMNEPEDVLRRCFELYHRGELAHASELSEHALHKFSDDGALWQLDGLVRRDRGDFDGARRAREMAGVLRPLTPGAQCALADCYARAGQSARAHWAPGLSGIKTLAISRALRAPSKSPRSRRTSPSNCQRAPSSENLCRACSLSSLA